MSFLSTVRFGSNPTSFNNDYTIKKQMAQSEKIKNNQYVDTLELVKRDTNTNSLEKKLRLVSNNPSVFKINLNRKPLAETSQSFQKKIDLLRRIDLNLLENFANNSMEKFNSNYNKAFQNNSKKMEKTGWTEYYNLTKRFGDLCRMSKAPTPEFAQNLKKWAADAMGSQSIIMQLAGNFICRTTLDMNPQELLKEYSPIH